MTTKKASELKVGDKIHGCVISRIDHFRGHDNGKQIYGIYEVIGKKECLVGELFEDEDVEIDDSPEVESQQYIKAIADEIIAIAETPDRLTNDELSPSAKREIGLIDRLLGIQPEPQSIDPLELSPETGCVEGIDGGIYIHYSAKNDEEAIAVNAPATMYVDEVNYRVENFIDRHVDLASAVIYGDRVHYRQLTEPTESGFVLERDPELVDRLLTNRFGFDRHATR